MPKTSFSCRDKILGGYYADAETQCQMFHVCVKIAGVGVSRSETFLHHFMLYWYIYHIISQRYKITGFYVLTVQPSIKRRKFAVILVTSIVKAQLIIMVATISICIGLVPLLKVNGHLLLKKQKRNSTFNELNQVICVHIYTSLVKIFRKI
jgi:hypothetical protein